MNKHKRKQNFAILVNKYLPLTSLRVLFENVEKNILVLFIIY